jgi:hypothetical protein
MDKTYYVGKVVEILPGIEDQEADYLEPGMLMRITRIDLRQEDLTVVHYDVSEFEDRNRPLETANYYDKNQVPCLTAREAGYFKPQDTIYLPGIESYGQFFKPVDPDGSTKLAEAYAARDDKSLTYVAWCEQEILRLWD